MKLFARKKPGGHTKNNLQPLSDATGRHRSSDVGRGRAVPRKKACTRIQFFRRRPIRGVDKAWSRRWDYASQKAIGAQGIKPGVHGGPESSCAASPPLARSRRSIRSPTCVINSVIGFICQSCGSPCTTIPDRRRLARCRGAATMSVDPPQPNIDSDDDSGSLGGHLARRLGSHSTPLNRRKELCKTS